MSWRRGLVISWALVLGLGARSVTAQTPEQRTARYLESIRSQPLLELEFLQGMPKGADLHNHLSGAVYAETFIRFAAEDALCVDPRTLMLWAAPCDPARGLEPAARGLSDQSLRDRMIDAWSMRNFHPTPDDRSGHDHFFAAFGKFGLASQHHTGEMLAEVASRAALQHESYLELMLTPDHGEAARLGERLGWDEDFARMRQKLLAGGLKQVVADGRRNLDQAERRMRSALHCGTPQPDPGCRLTVRYLYQVLRGLPKQAVFAQIVAGFELATQDSRVVGLNLVMPEDGYVAMRDFDLHMHLLDFLHRLYPQVRITLHAGELAPGLVPPDGLRFHIRESIELGHAERIGHGVDVMNEDRSRELLREMAARHVLVEICLTSNDLILGVPRADHPLPVYIRYGVPVALATDDEGVSRSELTWEYLRAVRTFHLSYAQLKRMVRDSLDHAFVSGASLWQAPEDFRPVAACASDRLGTARPSVACRRFLSTSEKAKLEWAEETAFTRFEAGFQ